MSPEALRWIERLHAGSAWLATGALVGAAIACVRGARAVGARLGAVAVALVTCAAALGLALHDPYRARLRQRLFIASPSLGWLFERKQHLAFGAVMLSIGALATLALLRRVEARGGDAAVARDLRRAALIGWTASALFALFASAASALVARSASF